MLLNLEATIPNYTKSRSLYNTTKVLNDAIITIKYKQKLPTNFFDQLFSIIVPTTIEYDIPKLKYGIAQPGVGLEEFFTGFNCIIDPTEISNFDKIRKVIRLMFDDNDMLFLIHQLYLLNEFHEVNKKFKSDHYSKDLLTKFGTDISQIKMFFTFFNIHNKLITNLIITKYNLSNDAAPEIHEIVTSEYPINVYKLLSEVVKKYSNPDILIKIQDNTLENFHQKTKKLTTDQKLEHLKEKEGLLNVKELNLDIRKTEINKLESELQDTKAQFLDNISTFNKSLQTEIEQKEIEQKEIRKQKSKLISTSVEKIKYLQNEIPLITDILTQITTEEELTIQNSDQNIKRIKVLELALSELLKFNEIRPTNDVLENANKILKNEEEKKPKKIKLMDDLNIKIKKFQEEINKISGIFTQIITYDLDFLINNHSIISNIYELTAKFDKLSNEEKFNKIKISLDNVEILNQEPQESDIKDISNDLSNIPSKLKYKLLNEKLEQF